jgi:tetraacyldisaccharide 4'-kinase
MESRRPGIFALLLPFSLLYGIAVSIRNFLFNMGIFRSRSFDIPVISVGNITVGGTGKTPHVEHLVSLLKDDFRVGVLSRGYKRKSSGFRIASGGSSVDEIGDEPTQIKNKFPDVEVAVDGNRVRGINKLCSHNKELQTIILDDAFQHRWVKPGISILLIDYNQPLKEDYLLPAGRLREYASATGRASIIIITKCPPEFKPIERRIIMKELSLLPWQTLYFTSFVYGSPQPVFSDALPFPEREAAARSAFLMMTGVATPAPLYRHLRGIYPAIEQLSLPDHHRFAEKDMQNADRILDSLGGDRKIIITTEKDAVRFRKTANIDPLLRKNMYFIPITVKFLDEDGDGFKHQILRYVRSNKRKHIFH